MTNSSVQPYAVERLINYIFDYSSDMGKLETLAKIILGGIIVVPGPNLLLVAGCFIKDFTCHEC